MENERDSLLFCSAEVDIQRLRVGEENVSSDSTESTLEMLEAGAILFTDVIRFP